ncbi:aldehyde dehydrogenase family protein [Burkholderia sp. FERM BP-3421]|jgi:acyl-CoA reductase-like NAD-dependent aldehyde dehydrogenase|uniref:aldehyde dehydrogenase family protein n=1 Tax=Burkholderia sp. FERM BP-3421 TaxID=1494466 RepID=UPI003FCCD6BC
MTPACATDRCIRNFLRRAREAAHCGNAGATNVLPFGGFRQSGLGREPGRAVIDQYTESKSVMMNFG